MTPPDRPAHIDKGPGFTHSEPVEAWPYLIALYAAGVEVKSAKMDAHAALEEHSKHWEDDPWNEGCERHRKGHEEQAAKALDVRCVAERRLSEAERAFDETLAAVEKAVNRHE